MFCSGNEQNLVGTAYSAARVGVSINFRNAFWSCSPDHPVRKRDVFDRLLREIEAVVDSSLGREEKLKRVCELLAGSVDYYDWVGFYLVDEAKGNELVLGPFVGEPTEHVRIPFGRGVCGRAAVELKTIIVQDVSKETNYLACSPLVKSEIVVPIFREGNFVGELDIDSHQLAPFTEEDREFLEKVANLVAKVL